jgi:hypothetical protein
MAGNSFTPARAAPLSFVGPHSAPDLRVAQPILRERQLIEICSATMQHATWHMQPGLAKTPLVRHTM